MHSDRKTGLATRRVDVRTLSTRTTVMIITMVIIMIIFIICNSKFSKLLLLFCLVRPSDPLYRSVIITIIIILYFINNVSSAVIRGCMPARRKTFYGNEKARNSCRLCFSSDIINFYCFNSFLFDIS